MWDLEQITLNWQLQLSVVLSSTDESDNFNTIRKESPNSSLEEKEKAYNA